MQFWRCEPCPWSEWTLLSERIWKMLHLMGKKWKNICYDNIERWIKPEDPRALCSISLIFCCPSQSPTQRCPLQVSGFHVMEKQERTFKVPKPSFGKGWVKGLWSTYCNQIYHSNDIYVYIHVNCTIYLGGSVYSPFGRISWSLEARAQSPQSRSPAKSKSFPGGCWFNG